MNFNVVFALITVGMLLVILGVTPIAVCCIHDSWVDGSCGLSILMALALIGIWGVFLWGVPSAFLVMKGGHQ